MVADPHAPSGLRLPAAVVEAARETARLTASDALYASWQDGAGGVHIGLTPIATSEWLRAPPPPALRAAIDRERAALLRHRPNEVIALQPRSHGALEELASLVAQAHRDRRSTPSAAGAPATTPAVRTSCPALIDTALSGAEDWCVLMPEQHRYVLVAAAVFAPAHWRLAEKMGRSLLGIHAPVDTLAERIGDRMTRFFERLPPDRVFVRGNWHFDTSPARFQPAPRNRGRTVTAAAVGQALWLRVERQTLRRLPISGAIAFSIDTRIHPLDRLATAPAQLRALVAAVGKLAPADYAARGGAALIQPFLDWAGTVER